MCVSYFTGRIPASAAHIMVDWLCEHSSAPGSNGPPVSSFPSILTQVCSLVSTPNRHESSCHAIGVGARHVDRMGSVQRWPDNPIPVLGLPCVFAQAADGGVSKAMKMAGLSQTSGSVRNLPAESSGAQNSLPASPSGPWSDTGMRLERGGTSRGDGAKRSPSGSWWSPGRAA